MNSSATHDSDASVASNSNNRWVEPSLGALGVILTAALGGIATSQSVQTWYPTLQKPVFNPPSFVFGPVWTILYILIGISYALALKSAQGQDLARIRLTYWTQLALNLAWSFAFFGLKNPAAGLVVILLLLSAIVATILAFQKSSKVAAALLVPYALWVSFATILNFAIFQLNPTS